MSVFQNYAKALLDGADESQVRYFIEDLNEFKSLFASKDFVEVIKNPAFSSTDKINALKDSIGLLNDKVKRLINALISRGHALHLEKAITDVLNFIEVHSGQETAIIQTPVELKDTEKDAIRASLKKILNKEIKLKTVLDKSLIAGYRVQVCGKLFDNSLATHLNKLKGNFDKVEGSYEN